MEPAEIEEIAYFAERGRRQRLVRIVLPAILAAFMILMRILDPDIDGIFWYMLHGNYFVLLVLTLLGASAAAMVMAYLQTGFKTDQSSEFTNIILQNESTHLRKEQTLAKEALGAELDQVKSQILLLAKELGELKNVGLTPDDQQRATLVESLNARIRDEAATSLVKDIETRMQASFELSVRDRETVQHFDQSRLRLGKEIEALGRRGNLNLALGIFTTAIGLILLSFFVFSNDSSSKNPVEFAIHFLPRLTLIIFIEVFAYFFLRLYKSSLSEIKYFQNEMTNVESHAIALRAATIAGDPKVASEVISQLGKTERNHVLQKDQTTVDIERARIEKENTGEILKNLTAILQRKP